MGCRHVFCIGDGPVNDLIQQKPTIQHRGQDTMVQDRFSFDHGVFVYPAEFGKIDSR